MIRGNRRAAPFRVLASSAEKYLRAYYNEGFYDFSRNGEGFAISTFARWKGDDPCTVWDVGANKGQWAQTAHSILPAARVVSFEIIPALADQIGEAAGTADWWTVEQVGLSNEPGEVEVTWNAVHDSTNAIAPDPDSRWFAHGDVSRIICPVTTLDDYWKKAGEGPDFLKIDVEGHDWAVLEGGERLLSGSSAPEMIQFEYGHTWFGSQRMLGPVQRRLEGFGYEVGRLYPDHVDFRPFAAGDEHFRMGNMIAVRDNSLKALLSGK